MAQDKTLGQGKGLDMGKEEAIIMESWDPLSASRQRVFCPGWIFCLNLPGVDLPGLLSLYSLSFTHQGLKFYLLE
jgi:hypothetical protein